MIKLIWYQTSWVTKLNHNNRLLGNTNSKYQNVCSFPREKVALKYHRTGLEFPMFVNKQLFSGFTIHVIEKENSTRHCLRPETNVILISLLYYNVYIHIHDILFSTYLNKSRWCSSASYDLKKGNSKL